MKFKYHYLEKKLWRIEEDYFYEVSEENRYIYSNDLTGLNTIIFIGQDYQLIFLIYPRMLGLFAAKTSYAQKLKSGQTVYYEKEIVSKTSEITFEFTEEDQLAKEALNNCQECHTPIKSQPSKNGRKVLEFYGKWTGQRHILVCQKCLEKKSTESSI